VKMGVVRLRLFSRWTCVGMKKLETSRRSSVATDLSRFFRCRTCGANSRLDAAYAGCSVTISIYMAAAGMRVLRRPTQRDIRRVLGLGDDEVRKHDVLDLALDGGPDLRRGEVWRGLVGLGGLQPHMLPAHALRDTTAWHGMDLTARAVRSMVRYASSAVPWRAARCLGSPG
jgi:hypothetical protein